MELEAQIRGTNELVMKESAPAAQPSLMDGSVVSVKDEWSLVVGNMGEQAGVKIGMPLRVVREGPTDRDAPSGGCATENLRRGDSRNGFGKGQNKSGRPPPGRRPPKCDFKINGSSIDITLREDFGLQGAGSDACYSGPAGFGSAGFGRVQPQKGGRFDQQDTEERGRECRE